MGYRALIIGAVYMLRAVRNILHGPEKSEWVALKDASAWVKLILVLLRAALLLLGTCGCGATRHSTASVERSAASAAVASSGADASVGAGSVVVRNINDAALAMGVPAKIRDGGKTR